MFEPNAAPMWTRVKHGIENLLMNLWRSGALQGSKTDEAYHVQVGLGTTMTAQDIADGRLIIQVMLAMVRPSEFVVITLQRRVMP